ncbi:MAG: hypothetical protein RBR71_11510 [Gudongella sp.]|nr:hypothetical protein [Gudongella sp.]
MLQKIEDALIVERSLDEYPGYAMIATNGTIKVPMLVLTDSEEPDILKVTRIISLDANCRYTSEEILNEKVDPPVHLSASYFNPDKESIYDAIIDSILKGNTDMSRSWDSLKELTSDDYVKLMKDILKV